MRQKAKQLMGILLSLVMVLGLMPGMSLTAYAATDTYTALKNNATVVTFNGYNWYIIEDNSSSATEGTVTLLAADNAFGKSAFSDSPNNAYSSSKIKTALDALTTTGAFKDVADAIQTVKVKGSDSDTEVDAKLYLLDTTTANGLHNTIKTYNFPDTDDGMGGWWLRSPGSDDDGAACVFGKRGYVFEDGYPVGRRLGVRPALKLNLSSVIFSSDTNTFSLKPAHTHSFTYAASGATITATCSVANCTLTDSKATLTIAAPTLTTYNGTGDAAATLTGLSDFNTATGKTVAATEIKYVGRDSTTYAESTTAPTDAGKYTAKITVEEKTASVDYEIAKADPTASAPTATATYGQTLADVTLNNPDGNTAGTWTFVDAETTSVGDVGSHTFKANFTPTDTTNYNSKSNVNVTVTVSKAANPATVTSTASVTKGGSTIDLASNVTLNGATGDVSYEISGEANGCSLNGSVLTSGNETGSVTVNVTVAADDNYNALAATPITVTISDKGTQTITAENVTANYGDTDKKVTATTDGNGAISYAVKEGSADYIDVDASTGALTIKKVGTATVIVTAAETATYAQATKEVTVTINKANAVAATVTANSRTYDGTEKPLVTVTGEATGGEMQYALGTATEATEQYTTSIPAKTNAGTYYVWYKAKGDSSHADSDAGYVIAEIKKSEGGGTPSEKMPVYDGTAQELVTEGKAEGGTMMYAIGNETEATQPYTTTIPTATDAGTYYVWYMVKGDQNHKDTKPACVEATIAKKGLTVTAEAKSKTQGEADPALTYTAEGLVGSDTLTGALSREAGEDPGTYAITQGTLTAGDNYEITFTSAVLTINKKDEPAPVPSGGGSSGGGGGYYGGGAVQNQRRDAYSDVIGAAATNFWGSSPERIRNIELACEKLDGIVLQPGEVFSFNEALGGLTAEDGFAVAPVDPDDAATAEMGGGVSQVASTLYSGSLFALLETVERGNHPYAVPFIQPGTDAYVTDPGNADALDLKFRNTRGEPIRISATCRVDEATQLREVLIEIRSALTASDYMPIRFDNTWGGDQNAFLTETPYDLTRPGYRILLTHEEQAFTDDHGAGIRTLTHRKILDAAGMLVRDEILNQRLSGDSYAMDTYYTKG